MAPTAYVYSDYGDGLAFAMRLKASGVRTLFRCVALGYEQVGRGLVTLTRDEPPKGALVIFDGTGHGQYGAFLRKKGHPVIGGNQMEWVERNRLRGAALAAKRGIALPETIAFSTPKEAMAHLERQEGAWFVKFSGDHESAATAGAPDSETMLRRLRWLASKRHDLSDGELQRKVEGVEISTNGFFDGQRFVRPFDCTFEDKKQMAGNVGGSSGCEGNAIWLLDGDLPPLARDTVLRIEGDLRDGGYVGWIDANTIVGADGVPRFLEWTARAGFDATPTWMHLFGDDLFEQLHAAASGTLDRWVPATSGDMAFALRISVPPYPQERSTHILKEAIGTPLDPALLEDDGATLDDAMIGPDGLALACGSGLIGTLGGTGTDIRALRRSALARAKDLRITNLQYRIDPVARAEHDWATLTQQGVLRDPAVAA